MSISPQAAPVPEAPDNQKPTRYTPRELRTLAAMGAVGAMGGGFDAVLAGLSTAKGSLEALKTGVALLLASALGPDNGLKPGEMGRLERQFTDYVAAAAKGALSATTSIPQGAHDGLRAGQAIVEGRRERRAAAEPQTTNGTTHNLLRTLAVGVGGVLAQLKGFHARLTAGPQQ